MTAFEDARNGFHAALKAAEVYSIIDSTKKGLAASNTDHDSATSVRIGAYLAQSLGVSLVRKERLAAQTVGARFENLTALFLKDTFLHLGHLRPGSWIVDRVSSRGGLNIAKYDQYSHLSEVKKAVKGNNALRILLGEDYTIASDIVVARRPELDNVINAAQNLVDSSVANRTSIRQANTKNPTLHACVSCKWTMRSDRVQNSRFEALRLIRSRKGRVPHLVVVTAEPLPSRLASIALGTGDIDCVYHVALPELIEAVASIGESEAVSLLSLMVEGRRLRDIADLPLDLAV